MYKTAYVIHFSKADIDQIKFVFSCQMKVLTHHIPHVKHTGEAMLVYIEITRKQLICCMGIDQVTNA